MPHTSRSNNPGERSGSVATALLALARDHKGRSQTARLREVIEEVEAALKAGVRRRVILETLNGQGFSMTFKSFENALHRIRKQRRGGTESGAPKPQAVPTLPQPQSPAIPPANASEDATGTANDAVREALTNQQAREEKFSRYSNSSTLSTRLGQKKEF